jgi:hypothetical protein
MFICARQKMRLCGLDREILYASLKNSFAQNFPRDDNYNNFHAQTESVAGPKTNVPMKFQIVQPKKVSRKDFWRSTPSKWPRSRNTGCTCP